MELATSSTLSRKDYLERIPGSEGWPLVGHTVQLFRDYRGVQNRMYAAHGPVHRLKVLGDVRVSLLGPEANELVLADKEQIFSSSLGWKSVASLMEGGLIVRDFEEHRAHRKAMAPAFKISALNDYLQSMQPIIAARLESWRSSPPALFHPALKELLLEIAMAVFLGQRDSKDIPRLKAAFIAVVNATVAVIRAPIPGTTYQKGMEGRRVLYEYALANIRARRAGEGKDLFSQLCRATDESGEHWSDDDIAKHVLFVMGAAHDTTTSSICTLISALATRPEWQQRLREESARLDADHLAYADLDKMPLCEYSFKEALRLYPPVVTINRFCLRSFTFKGFTIPARTLITISPTFTHMMPELWKDPGEFDPLRFSPERAEDKKHRFAWIPFGGGAHQCIGMVFAYVQVKAFIAQFLSRFQLSLPHGYRADMTMLPIPRPKDGLPLILKKL